VARCSRYSWLRIENATSMAFLRGASRYRGPSRGFLFPPPALRFAHTVLPGLYPSLPSMRSWALSGALRHSPSPNAHCLVSSPHAATSRQQLAVSAVDRVASRLDHDSSAEAVSSSAPMKLIYRTLEQLRGQFCWGARFYRESGLAIDLGKPHLSIRQPYETSSDSELVQRMASYRDVIARGDWFLLIWFGRWRLTLTDSPPVTNSSSYRRINQSLTTLNGQRFVGGTISKSDGATAFYFDLGAQLEINGSDIDTGELWTLYKPSRAWLQVRNDGNYSHANVRRGSRWRPIHESVSVF
jgi:hypothetical protein